MIPGALDGRKKEKKSRQTTRLPQAISQCGPREPGPGRAGSDGAGTGGRRAPTIATGKPPQCPPVSFSCCVQFCPFLTPIMGVGGDQRAVRSCRDDRRRPVPLGPARRARTRGAGSSGLEDHFLSPSNNMPQLRSGQRACPRLELGGHVSKHGPRRSWQRRRKS